MCNASHFAIHIFVAVKHNGNITMDDVINIARTMRPRSMSKTLAGTCKEVLGMIELTDP